MKTASTMRGEVTASIKQDAIIVIGSYDGDEILTGDTVIICIQLAMLPVELCRNRLLPEHDPRPSMIPFLMDRLTASEQGGLDVGWGRGTIGIGIRWADGSLIGKHVARNGCIVPEYSHTARHRVEALRRSGWTHAIFSCSRNDAGYFASACMATIWDIQPMVLHRYGYYPLNGAASPIDPATLTIGPIHENNPIHMESPFERWVTWKRITIWNNAIRIVRLTNGDRERLPSAFADYMEPRNAILHFLTKSAVRHEINDRQGRRQLVRMKRAFINSIKSRLS